MLFNDPEAPTTIDERFDYGPLTGGAVTGSAVIDPGSIVALDPSVQTAAPACPARRRCRTGSCDRCAHRPARIELPDRGRRAQSVNGTNLAVMGPQLGYYYPEIVKQIHLSGPGIEAQGAAVPGLAMYILIGRTRDYAWSLTSASHDVRDVFVEELCNPDGSDADTRVAVTTCSTASAARSRYSTPARSTALRSATRCRCTGP